MGTVPLADAAGAADATIGTGTMPSSHKQAKVIKRCYRHRTHQLHKPVRATMTEIPPLVCSVELIFSSNF